MKKRSQQKGKAPYSRMLTSECRSNNQIRPSPFHKYSHNWLRQKSSMDVKASRLKDWRTDNLPNFKDSPNRILIVLWKRVTFQWKNLADIILSKWSKLSVMRLKSDASRFDTPEKTHHFWGTLAKNIPHNDEIICREAMKKDLREQTYGHGRMGGRCEWDI